MTQTPVRIVIHDLFIDEFKPFLDVTHTLKPLGKQSDAEIADLLCETDVLVADVFKRSWRKDHLCAVKLVHSTGAGVDGVDISSLPKGCTLCNVYGHERGMAELAFMLMTALQRKLFAIDKLLRKGDWMHQVPYLPELRYRNLLIIGLGKIGQELMRWGNFLEMKVTALTRSPEKMRKEDTSHGTVSGLNDLTKYLPSADFVIVAVPATSDTINLIGETELKQMKPSAFLINIGRAAVVNEQALYQTLLNRNIAGAGLDVWYQYPETGQIKLPSSQPFYELDNVIMTPHKPTIETMDYRWREIAANIKRFTKGEPYKSIVHSA
ncbi:MAG: hypothetical protein JNK79_19460 [Chitinophagaceae bacterium]|nr:hypothetical protein [Chitinophagaceae bacterium]